MTQVPGHPGLEQTHPNFVYCEPHHTGVLYRGRPVRSNYKVYKLPIECADQLEKLMEAGSPTHGPAAKSAGDVESLMLFIKTYEIRWSQAVNRAGHETFQGGAE